MFSGIKRNHKIPKIKFGSRVILQCAQALCSRRTFGHAFAIRRRPSQLQRRLNSDREFFVIFVFANHTISSFYFYSSFLFFFQVSPQSFGGGIMFESNNGIVTRYNQNYQKTSQVPHPVREKLRQLPLVIEHLIQPKHKSIR